ncbi:hypothetical protein BpHYR1_051466 [Brachionus plicatilis]|uniref:Uncharacterized protein n=1 Tax=Brachionus plicatilis TaxID=10195 RepID=A0A3M7QCP5_BRAPC|nr:hypothetical protein BpHYR1_051466 [Brachionus plicatilis]
MNVVQLSQILLRVQWVVKAKIKNDNSILSNCFAKRSFIFDLNHHTVIMNRFDRFSSFALKIIYFDYIIFYFLVSDATHRFANCILEFIIFEFDRIYLNKKTENKCCV